MGLSSHLSSHGFHGPKKLAAIVTPIILVVLILLGGVAWWLLTRRKEKKRVDRLAEKAIWMDQSYINSIREKMLGMDEEKVGNVGVNILPMSNVPGVGRSNTLLGSQRLSVISDSIPTLRRSSKQINRTEYLEMARTSNEARASNVENLTDTPLDLATNGEADGTKAIEHDLPTSAASHGHTNIDDAITGLSVMPQSPTEEDSIDLPSDALTSSVKAATTVEEETQETTTHQRSGSVVSRLSHRLERAVRRRSGVEELR